MKILRPYQHEALDISCQHYHDGNKRALVVMASGLGKSVFAAALVNKWFEGHTGRILFLVDTIDILKQVNGEFREALDPKYSTCIVSSHLEGDPCAEVVLSTFQTMQNMCVDLPKDEFSLIIVDEAHHGHAVTYRPTIEYFEPLFSIGMTATPDRMDGKDIREIFGEEIYSYPLSEALVDDWLAEVDYRLMTDNLSIR